MTKNTAFGERNDNFQCFSEFYNFGDDLHLSQPPHISSRPRVLSDAEKAGAIFIIKKIFLRGKRSSLVFCTEWSREKRFYNVDTRSSGPYYKNFMIVIYDHNDRSHHFKTTNTIILTILAKAASLS